ncbi:MAG TPA: pseudouridine synthase [Candidatus Saccharimonadales bacterium]|nr:pseudouridine synthase [Candidatus Saccharimonadales bacterium]
MRINKFIARATGLSRRAADQAVGTGRVTVNGRTADIGVEVHDTDQIALDGQTLALPAETITVMLNKPVGYVCSRTGQGSRTVYDLLTDDLHSLKPVGRLDKDSSGLLLLTNDGDLANRLAHPRHDKEKVYEVELDKPLTAADASLVEAGVKLEDGISKLQIGNRRDKSFTVAMREGRNRQIRRTFAECGYEVKTLHRITLGPYRLGNLPEGTYAQIAD